jgi:hypothetical protein
MQINDIKMNPQHTQGMFCVERNRSNGSRKKKTCVRKQVNEGNWPIQPNPLLSIRKGFKLIQ